MQSEDVISCGETDIKPIWKKQRADSAMDAVTVLRYYGITVFGDINKIEPILRKAGVKILEINKK